MADNPVLVCDYGKLRPARDIPQPPRRVDRVPFDSIRSLNLAVLRFFSMETISWKKNVTFVYNKNQLTNGVLGQKGCRPIVCWDIRCVDKLIWDKLCVCPLRSSKGL